MEIVASVEYRDIPGFAGYRICVSHDDVWIEACRNKRGEFTDRWKRLASSKGSNGYLATHMISSEGVRKSIRIHSACCMAFYGPRPDGMECRHLDGNRLNNLPGNLAWGTFAENMADRTKHGTCVASARRGSKSVRAKITEEIAAEIRASRAAGVRLQDLAKQFGISESTVSAIAVGRIWKVVA